MTKVKGIETKQIVLESLMGIFSLIVAIVCFSAYIVESRKVSFFNNNNNETIFQILSLILLIWGVIEFVCIFKKMGNYVEIYSEKIAVKSFQLSVLASATKIAEIEYKDIKSVNMEKKGIIPWLVINTTTERYKVNVKDVDKLIPMIKQKAGLK